MTKISDEELQKVKQNREQVLTNSQQLSDLVLQQTLLEEQIGIVKSQFLTVFNRERNYLESLNDKYGEGLLDIETGEIKTT
mgnify:CR=1 FL=1|tara:strand:- start:269 stop:511 length:243 start_codon:yes stop_codon:yes gene_type:complete